jgi:hypothetical protein
LIDEARSVRRGIASGAVGGKYFDGLSRPPVSHFAVSPQMERLLSALELNFLITKYHEMRDKNGTDVSIYAFAYGLCEAENFPWGYPRGGAIRERFCHRTSLPSRQRFSYICSNNSKMSSSLFAT